MGLKQRLVSLANGALSVTGARLVSAHNFEQLQVLYRHRDSYDEPVFRVGQRTLSYFAHRYNCGWPDLAWCSERSLELALADTWLELVPPETVTEIGAVTPYYWPCRVAEVVDPADPHPRVTARKSIFDVSLAGRSVLSVSTFEHIGRGDYGLPTQPGRAAAAIEKLFAESATFLVTFGNGFNPPLDEFVISRRGFPADVETHLFARNASGIGWTQRSVAAEAMRPYGSGTANSVLIIHRGTDLFRS